MKANHRFIGTCPECLSKVQFIHDVPSKKGLAHFIKLSCTTCKWTSAFATSQNISKELVAKQFKSKDSSCGENLVDFDFDENVVPVLDQEVSLDEIMCAMAYLKHTA